MIKCAVEKAPSHDPCGCGSRPSFIYVLEMWLRAEKRDVEVVMAGVMFCRNESSSLVKRVTEFSYERADEPLHGPRTCFKLFARSIEELKTSQFCMSRLYSPAQLWPDIVDDVALESTST